MKDIAEKVGVDRSTVSLALKNDPRISEKTRELIHQTARELNYRPDPAFKILGAQRWKSRETTTGFVMAFLTYGTQAANPVVKQYRDGARRKAEELGFGFSDFHVSDYATVQKANQVLVNRGVSGLMFFRPLRPEFLRGYQWDQFSSICIGLGYFQPSLNAVEHDHSRSIHTLWQRARERGAKRIGALLVRDEQSFDYVNDVGSIHYEQRRQENASDAQTVPPFIFDPSQSEEAILKDFALWMRKHEPQVVIGFCDYGYELLVKAGFEAPGQVSFLSLRKYGGLEDIEADREISGIDLNREQCGEIAASLLSMQILQNERGLPDVRITHVVETQYVEGETFARKF